MKVVQLGENVYVRLLLLLGAMNTISLFFRFLVVRLIPGSPLHEFANEGSYFISMAATVLINHFWVEVIQAEKRKSTLGEAGNESIS